MGWHPGCAVVTASVLIWVNTEREQQAGQKDENMLFGMGKGLAGRVAEKTAVIIKD